MALKKSDLYASLWASCDQLRGGMDASQYKDYILTLLFVKYVSDKAKGDPNSLIDVPAGGSFDDMLVPSSTAPCAAWPHRQVGISTRHLRPEVDGPTNENQMGSCNRETRHIWFSVELAKKHADCLEYIVVHEIPHYFERNHGDAFARLMTQHLPDWESRRRLLNAEPLAAEEWPVDKVTT